METTWVLVEEHVGLSIGLLSMHNKAGILTVIGDVVLWAESVECKDIGESFGIEPDIVL